MAIPHEKAVLAVGQAVQASQLFATVNPSIMTIRHPDFGAHDGLVKDIRDGEKIATVLVIGSGIILAFLLDDAAPLYTSIAAALIMIGIYEWALATRHVARESDANSL